MELSVDEVDLPADGARYSSLFGDTLLTPHWRRATALINTPALRMVQVPSSYDPGVLYHAVVALPRDISTPVPVLHYVYGGPHVQLAINASFA